jgi:tetratricopeptide (TPR) repeat protein
MTIMAIVGAVCMGLSPFQPWIESPIRGQAHTGLGLEWLAMAIGGLAVVILVYRASRMLAFAGVTGLGLCAFSVLHLALFDPTLWVLVDENAQLTQIMAFSRLYLPANLGVPPTFQALLATDTVADRLVAAAYFMGLGWWACLMGGILLIIAACAIGGRQTIQWAAFMVMVLLASQGMLMSKGLMAQFVHDRGNRYMARGQYAEAIPQYESAQHYDPQLSRSAWIHRQLGEAYYQLGDFSHPQARFYVADRYAQEGNPQGAITEYLLATQDASGHLAHIIQRRLAWTYAQLGSMQYRREEQGGAIAWWEKALSVDTSQLQAAYFLVRAYFVQGRYEQSIAMGEFLVSRSQNRLVNADVQANIGDSYWKLQKFGNARQAYADSLRLDPYANFRVFKSLGGT